MDIHGSRVSFFSPILQKYEQHIEDKTDVDIWVTKQVFIDREMYCIKLLQAFISEMRGLRLECFCVDTLRPRQKGRHFSGNIFKCIFLYEDVWISIKISPKLIPMICPINILTKRQAIIWTNDGIINWRVYASLGLNNLKPFRPVS